MRHTRLPATVAAVFALATAAGAGTAVVSVTVKPRTALAGERVAVSARTGPMAARCSGRVTQRGARPSPLPARKPVRGSARWTWAAPVASKSGLATATVTCAKDSASARFAVRALPTGNLEAGRTAFLLNCGGCHTLADAGTTGTSVDLDQKRPSYELTVDRVINGKGLMRSFKPRLTPQQIADVAIYVSSVAGR